MIIPYHIHNPFYPEHPKIVNVFQPHYHYLTTTEGRVYGVNRIKVQDGEHYPNQNQFEISGIYPFTHDRPLAKFYQSAQDNQCNPMWDENLYYTPAMGPQYYTVKQGDTLESVSSNAK